MRYPLVGVLKLNFDGMKEERKGGYGGIIRNNYGYIICTILGPVKCVDVNRPEGYTVLMGYRELKRIVVRNTIIEGGSFLTIQLGLGKSKCPWCLADWIG